MASTDLSAAWTLTVNAILPCILLFGIGWALTNFAIAGRVSRHQFAQTKSAAQERSSDVLRDNASINGYPPIEPLTNFNWEEAEQIQIRSFKPKYNLTMALTSVTASDLLSMDKTYRDRIMLRRKLISENISTIIRAEPRVHPSVAEFYTWVFNIYLPTRYPGMFRVSETTEPVAEAKLGASLGVTKSVAGKQSKYIRNLVTDEVIAAVPPEDTIEALRLLGSHIDEDFFFLLPHESNDGTYALAGVCCCFPNGFNPGALVGKRLQEIHGPVPGYKEKLQLSMNRYFASIPVGKFNKRTNWGISTDNVLFAAFIATHGREGHETPEEKFDISKVQIRSELQTLHRLPGTKGLIFAFHTYMYSLADIKAEGNGPVLAEGIAGLDKGNVPGITQYKRRDVWGPAVTEYLLSET